MNTRDKRIDDGDDGIVPLKFSIDTDNRLLLVLRTENVRWMRSLVRMKTYIDLFNERAIDFEWEKSKFFKYPLVKNV